MAKKPVGTKKRGRPRKPDALTPKERKARFIEANPEAEARQKEKERYRDRMLRFYIARNHIGKHPLPEFIDANSEAFKRVEKAYLEECAAPVEVVEEAPEDGK